MIIFIRGHIRNSFSNNQLYCLIKQLHADFGIKLYIHTWNIIQSNVSWRKIPLNTIPISREMIIQYFNDLAPIIEEIMIEDDHEIQVIGTKEGFICKSKCPVVGWKNMWYGKYSMLEHIYYTEKSLETDLSQTPVLNMRFDVQDNYIPFQYHTIKPFLEKCLSNQIVRNEFLYNKFRPGIDNIYLGSIQTMYDLTSHFHLHLDTIVKKYPHVTHQEELVFLENNRLYG